MTTWDLGDTVPLAVDVTDEAGAAVTPAGVTLTVELPDGTPLSPTVANPVTGRYEADFVPLQPGRHIVRWVSAAPDTAFVDVIDVRPAHPRYLVSLDAVKGHLNIPATETDHDEELRGHIEAATHAVESYLGEVVARRTVVERRDVPHPTNRIVLDRYPVVSLTSVARLDGSATWDVGGIDVDGDTGVVRVLSGARLSGSLLVTYVAGRAVVPAAYTLAAKMVVEHLYSPQRSPGAGPPGSPGGADAELTPDEYGVVIPSAARELLGVSGPLVG